MTPKSSSKKPRKYTVPGLERGLEVLDALSRQQRPATIAELTELLGVPRSSVFRVLWTLEKMGFVESDASGKAYQLGPGVLRLGFQYLASRDVVQVARADVKELAARTGVSAHLVVRDGRDIVYLVHAAGNSNFVSNLGVGDQLPAHATPSGQLLLSALSHDELVALYPSDPLPALTPKTPRTRAQLERVIGEAAARGYVISHGAVHPGGKSIAAAIYDAAGVVTAAVDVSGPDMAFDKSAIESRYVPQVVRTALRISARLGYTGKAPDRQ